MTLTGLVLSVLFALPATAIADDGVHSPATTPIDVGAAQQMNSPATTAPKTPVVVDSSAQATSGSQSGAVAAVGLTGGLPPDPGSSESPGGAPSSGEGSTPRGIATPQAALADRVAGRSGATNGGAVPSAAPEGDAPPADPVPEGQAAGEAGFWPAAPLAEPELVVAGTRQRSAVLPLALLIGGLVLTARPLLTRRRQATVPGR